MPVHVSVLARAREQCLLLRSERLDTVIGHKRYSAVQKDIGVRGLRL
jgi:hypothetical protein